MGLSVRLSVRLSAWIVRLWGLHTVLMVLALACPDNALERAMKCTAGLGLMPQADNAYLIGGQVETAKQACRDRKLQDVVSCLEGVMGECQGRSDEEYFLRTMVDIDKARSYVTLFCSTSHLNEYEKHAPCIIENHGALNECVLKEQRNMMTKVKATSNMDYLMIATCKYLHACEVCSQRVLTSACGKGGSDIVAGVFAAFKPPVCDSDNPSTGRHSTDAESRGSGDNSSGAPFRPSVIIMTITTIMVMVSLGEHS